MLLKLKLNMSSKLLTQWGIHTIISEHCVWLEENPRNICISYIYRPHTGTLHYSACIFHSKEKKMDDTDVSNCEKTTLRRFELCPVKTSVDTNKINEYKDIIKTIRYLMCHKYGCKGNRIKNTDRTDSPNEYLSESPDSSTHDYSIEQYQKYAIKQLNSDNTYYPVVYTKYFHSDNYEKYGYHRCIYIAFRGCPMTGDLIYSACVNRDIDYNDESSDSNHFYTAYKRIMKSPIYIRVDEEFHYQLDQYSKHFEDITHIIVDNIFNRKNGRMKIKQY